MRAKCSAKLSPNAAAAIVLVHNHPSGDPDAVADDLRVTTDLFAGRPRGSISPCSITSSLGAAAM